MSDDERNEDESSKPRRLEESDEVVKYLVSLDTQLTGERDLLRMEEEEMEVLVENVLSEIKTRTASAACDRRTNSIIEKLVFSSNIKQIGEIVGRFIPYATFLACNRHSSHVIQAIFSRLSYLLKKTDASLLNEDMNQLSNIMVTFCDILIGEFSQLMKDMSASHVLRSMICTLVGMPVVSERKGKGSKHQHSIILSEPLESLILIGKFYINHDVCFNVPKEFHNLLVNACDTILLLSPYDLQCVISDATSCAVISLLLRILYNEKIINNGPDIANKIVFLSFEWNNNVNFTGSNIFYEMAGDKSGSYYLETVVECIDVDKFIDIINNTIILKAIEYSSDKNGNFVLQAILKRLIAIKDNKKDSNKNIDKLCDQILIELCNHDTFDDLLLTKGGVLLWMLGLVKVHKKLPTNVKDFDTNEIYWADYLGNMVISSWTKNNQLEFTNVIEELLKEKENIVNNERQKGNNSKEIDKDNDTKQILIAKILGAMIKLKKSSISKIIMNTICKLPSHILLKIAQSGQLSKAIYDSFFDNFENGSIYIHSFINDFIKPNLLLLSCHFVGQHVIENLFNSVDIKTKEKIAVAINIIKDNLTKNKEGRNTLRVIKIDLFARSPYDWKEIFFKSNKINPTQNNIKANSNISNIKKDELNNTDDVNINGNNNNEDENKKRKRKRNRKDTQKIHHKFEDDEE